MSAARRSAGAGLARAIIESRPSPSYKDGSLRELHEKLTTGKGRTRIDVDAHYRDGKSDVTRVRADLPGTGEDVKVTVPGLDLLRLATADGLLLIDY